VLDVLTQARWWAWKFNLVLVTAILIFVLPYSFFYLMLRNSDWAWQQASYLAAVPLSLYLWAFYYITNSLPIAGQVCDRESIYLSVYLYLYLSVCLSIYLFIYLSIYPSIYLSIHLSIHPSIRPSIYLYL